MSKNKNGKVDIEQIEADIINYSRAPFRSELARVLGCRPDEDSIQAFARKHADRFYQSVAILGRLAGFSEKLEVDGTLNMKINAMSDSQLLAEYERLTNKIKEELRQEMAQEEKQ